MKVVNLPVEALKPGMMIYEDIYNSLGALILNRNVVLNQDQIAKLVLNGVEKVRIRLADKDGLYDEKGVEEIKSIFDKDKIMDFRKKYEVRADEIKHIIKDISSGKFVDINQIAQVGRHIVEEFSTINDVLNYIHLVRPLDDYTYAHSLNVSIMSIIIAKWLKFSNEEIDEIAIAGLLHDVGKTRIPEKLLMKPGSLTAEEFEEVKKHTVFGYMMLENVKDATSNMKSSVLMHHEKIDGSGYPIGASDQQIPIFAKIVAVADIYDAMTSNRSYRKKMCPFEVIRNLEMQTFGKLDTKVLTVFLKNIANSYMNDFVELNTGEICEIVFINPNRVWQPIVRFGTEYIDLSCDEKRRIKEII